MFRNALTRTTALSVRGNRGPWLTSRWTKSKRPGVSVGSNHYYSCLPLNRPFPPRASRSSRTFSTVPSQNDTIYALSSGQGRAGIAVIRISGKGCKDVYEGLCPSKAPPQPRYAAVRTLLEPGSPAGRPNVLDSNALVIYFPGPRTVTGEDVLELHVHGGPATVKAVLSAIARCPSASRVRYAEPGEFTKRAFLNDRLDLAQVESLGDMLAADTEQQRRAAVRGNSGALGKTYETWRQQLVLARGEIEALIDFSEDQHFDESPAELLGNVSGLVREILHSIQLHETGSQRSELLRSGIRIALLGPPNVGKSSLMNRIVGREASIVSHEAGTTRDIVEASLDIRGYLCSFADTAGLRSQEEQQRQQQPTSNPVSSGIGAVEEEGIRRAKRKAQDSDVIIALAAFDASPGGRPGIHYDEETLRLAAVAQQCLIAINKSDTVPSKQRQELITEFTSSVLSHVPGLESAQALAVSCWEAEAHPSRLEDDPGGIQALMDGLTRAFASMTEMPADLQDLLGVTERQRQLLVRCRQHLEDYLHEAGPANPACEPDIVLAAEHLRFAADCLARITGRGEAGDVEEVLGVIFEKFCVGK